MRSLPTIALLLLLGSALSLFSACRGRLVMLPTPAGAPRDTLAFSFAVLGCNRVDKNDVDLAVNPSTANQVQLLRTCRELVGLRPAPTYVFMMGDLVMGYDPDSAVIGRQLRAWVRLYRSSALGRVGATRLAALPGNHEVMSGKNMPAYQGAEAAWLKALAPYLPPANGPHRRRPRPLGYRPKLAHVVV